MGEDLRLLAFRERREGVADAPDILFGELAVLLPQVLAQRLEPGDGVDGLHLAAPVLGLAVGEDPDVRGDAGVVEDVEGQSHDGFQPVVLDDPAADVALALAGIAREEGRAVVDFRDAAAQGGALLHLGELVHQEHELAVAGAGDHLVVVVVAVLDDKTRVGDVTLSTQALQIRLPAFAIGRVGEHEVKFLGGETIRRQGGAELDVLRLGPLAFE